MKKIFRYENEAGAGAILVPSEVSRERAEALAELFSSLSMLSRLYENAYFGLLYGNWQELIQSERLRFRVIVWGNRLQLRLWTEEPAIAEMVRLNECYLMLRLRALARDMGNTDAKLFEVRLVDSRVAFETVALSEFL